MWVISFYRGRKSDKVMEEESLKMNVRRRRCLKEDVHISLRRKYYATFTEMIFYDMDQGYIRYSRMWKN